MDQPTRQGNKEELRGIRDQEGVRLLEAIQQGVQHLAHGLKAVGREQRPQALPHQPLAAQFGPDRSAEGPAPLLGVGHHKRQPPPRGTHHGKRLLAMTLGVLNLVARIFQRIARRMFTRPPRPATAHELRDRTLTHAQVRHPTAGLDLVLAALPIREAMDLYGRSRGRERHVVHQAKAMDHTCSAVVPLRRGPTSSLLGSLHLVEHIGRIAFFAPEEIMTTIIVPGLDVGGMGTATVFGDDALERRVSLAQCDDAALGRMAFTLIFLSAILFHHGFRHQRNPCTHVRMDDRRAQPLVLRGARTVAVDRVETRGTGHRLGGTRPRASKRHSRGVRQKGPRFQRLPALSWPQDTLAQRAARLGRPRIASLSHPRIARHACHAVDRPQSALCSRFIQSEERRRWQGQQGERRPQGIGEGNLCIGRAMIWDSVEAATHQAQERIGGEMLAFFGGNTHHGKPHQQNIQVFQ